MSAKYPIVAVFLDGTTPTTGLPPLLPYPQALSLPAGTDATLVVSCVGQDGNAYTTSGSLQLSVAGTVLVTGTLTSASSITLGIAASQTAITAKVYPWSLDFVDGSANTWQLVPESIYAILPSE